MPYNADQHEKEILKFWQENHIFEKSVSERPEKRPYVFYDGPPFATGLPHYGHILSSVIKDVVPRYWTMKGFRVRRRWGWDCHGLPIESLIEKELNISGKKDIEEKIGVEQFNETCRSRVLMYTKEWKKMVDRIGRWVEFDTAYKTMDPSYMESVWWALKRMWDKGLIYEGRKVLMYCPRCETPVSKAEVAMDNSYKDITEEAVTAKFKIKRLQDHNIEIPKDTFILAWTTTPWTLPGNAALYVGADIWYVLVKYEGVLYIIGEECLSRYFGHGKEFEIVKRLWGSELDGVAYEPLFAIPAMRQSGTRAWHVGLADFVATDEGTGVVHSAVMHGEEDYAKALEQGLPIVPLLDGKGVYTGAAPEFLRGQYYKHAERDIKNDLERRGLLFSREQYTHSYPHCWRCETQLYYNAVSSWFINIQKVKGRMIQLNEKVNWFPDHLKHGRFLNIMKEAPDWNISRNRYWATALPFWRCQKGNPKFEIRNPKSCDMIVCVGSIAELKKMAINFDEVYKSDMIEEMDLHRHVVDKIRLRCENCGGEMTRVPEVLDSWVEAASMPFAEWHYPFENKKTFEKRFPGQYIAEYIAQTRTWFYYMHAVAVILFDDISFENVVCTGTILNAKGEKLSKSKRNFTDPWVIIEQYGTDALRYYLMTSVVMQAENVFFKDNEVRDTYNKVINILWNVVEFYKMNADESSEFRVQSSESDNILDRWILAKLQVLVKEVTEYMDKYDTVKAGRPIKEFIDDLSTWYVRRSRDRFKIEGEAKAFALATLREVLLTLSKVMAPFTPFIAERIYFEIGRLEDWKIGDMKESVHLEIWPEVNKKMMDETVIEEMAMARKIVEMGLSLRAEAAIRVRQALGKFSIFNFQFSNELKTIIADELNVKEIYDSDATGNGWTVKEDGQLKVALNTTITLELQKEGLLREVIRAINQMRKENGLTVRDEIAVEYATGDALLGSVFAAFGDEIKKGVAAREIRQGGGEEMEIDGRTLRLNIQKHV